MCNQGNFQDWNIKFAIISRINFNPNRLCFSILAIRSTSKNHLMYRKSKFSMSLLSVIVFLARIPPWTAGWSVFTRPPSISGAPVISETSLRWSESNQPRIIWLCLGTLLGLKSKYQQKWKRQSYSIGWSGGLSNKQEPYWKLIFCRWCLILSLRLNIMSPSTVGP